MKKNSKIVLLLIAAVTALSPVQGCGSKSSSVSEGSAEGSSAVSGESTESGDNTAADSSQDSQENTGQLPGDTDSSASGGESQTEPAQTSVVVDDNGSTRIVTVTSAQPQQEPQNPGSSASEQQNQNQHYDITVAVDQVKAKAGQERVPVSVRITNNSGFATGGLTIHHDPALVPVTTDAAGTIEYKLGSEMDGMMTYGTSNEENGYHLVAFAFFSQTEDITANDILMTFYMNVPENAASGSVYQMRLDVDDIKNIGKKSLNIQSIDGSITIE
ncbi:MAG: hypothetical protein IJ060_04465 [Oscillospiraceae bacterium]|nr:hypothetical protein [Oscillospiraceae bacterium]